MCCRPLSCSFLRCCSPAALLLLLLLLRRSCVCALLRYIFHVLFRWDGPMSKTRSYIGQHMLCTYLGGGRTSGREVRKGGSPNWPQSSEHDEHQCYRRHLAQRGSARLAQDLVARLRRINGAGCSGARPNPNSVKPTLAIRCPSRISGPPCPPPPPSRPSRVSFPELPPPPR